MIRVSTTVSHGYTAAAGDPLVVDGNTLTFTVPMKSESSGDTAEVKAFQFRALAKGASDQILSSSGAHSVGSTTVSIIPKRRPQLMHQQGVQFFTNNSSVTFCDAAGPDTLDKLSVGTVTMLIRPVLGTVRVTQGSTTVDITSAGLLTITGSASAYINGEPWASGTSRSFPYPRLVTVVYDGSGVGPVTVGSTGTASFYMSQFAWSTEPLAAGEVQVFSALYYRKPSISLSGGSVQSTTLTDSAITEPPVDTPVTVPESWLTF